MTLDEAIKYHEDMAEINECAAKMLSDDAFLHMDSEYKNECRDNASKSSVACKDHRQLAEWLTELKELKNSIGAVKLNNMKEALALIRTLKAELNGWQEDPFSIIAEVCGAVKDCRRCQWYEKCPFPKNYGSYPEEWKTDVHP